MEHELQGLSLGLEPGHHLPSVHSQLDDLQGCPPLDRLPLLSDIDCAQSALSRRNQKDLAR
jgi:hypothetical protein